MKANGWLGMGVLFVLAAMGTLAAPAEAQVQVTSANPNNAPQGTTNLIVKIGGSGFKRGATSKFLVTGTTNPGGITVNSTAFVSDSEVDANLTISSTASISGFDIYVTSSGRTGKGTDLFSVQLGTTAVVHDYDSAGNLLLMRSDDYNGSGEATYSSAITSIDAGVWVLLLGKQSLRTLWVTPNDPVGAQPAGPPTGYYWDGVQSHSGCYDQNGNTVPLANVVTSSGNCRLGVEFVSGGTLYKLLMSPFPTVFEEGTAICPLTGCPATGVVTVTCNSVSGGACVSWTIVPNTSAPHVNVANLYSYQGGGRTTTWLFLGQYSQTFRIDVMTSP